MPEKVSLKLLHLKDLLVRVLWYFKHANSSHIMKDQWISCDFFGIDGFANNFSSSSSKIISTIITFLFGKTGCQKTS